ncbi:MAG: hypothetical protein VW397_07245 [Candidatus Margulisiibacteriota bacterium]
MNGIYLTPHKGSYCKNKRTEPKSAELIRTSSNILIDNRNLIIDGRNFNIKIEEGYIDAKNSPLSVRIQRDTKKIFERNSPTLTPVKNHWSGTYTGSSTEHSIGYLEPNSSSTLTKIYATKRVRFIRVSGTLISDPQVSSDTKAEEIKGLLISAKRPDPTGRNPQTPNLHLTRYLENLGYDIYLGQDNDEDETAIECILLKPKKFICEDIATVNVSKNGEHQINWIHQTTEELPLKTAINYLITQDNNKNDSHSINSESDQGSTSGESCSSDPSISSQESISDDESYSLNSLNTIPSDDESDDDENGMDRLIFSRNPKDLINFEAIRKEKHLRQSPTTVAIHL